MAHSNDVTRTIVKTVAEYEEVSPEELPPVSTAIDSQTVQQLTALDAHLTEPLEFEYLWYEVTVPPNGDITVTP